MKPARILLGLLGGTLLVIGAVYAVMGGEYPVPRLHALKAEVEDMERQIDSLRADLEEKGRFTEQLQADSAVIERVARERYGMVRDGEALLRYFVLEEGECDWLREAEMVFGPPSETGYDDPDHRTTTPRQGAVHGPGHHE